MAQSIETSEKRTQRLVAEFRRKLWHVRACYLSSRAYEPLQRSFNGSLEDLRRAVNPRARRKPGRRRLHPEIELLISFHARTIAKQHDRLTGAAPTQSDVEEAARQVAAQLRPRRGRRPNVLLTHYVHALMALAQETTGEPATASQTTDSEYDPHMSSAGGRMIEIFFSEADPDVTPTAIANIIRAARASGAVKGKRFIDFFPFYGGGVDPVSGHPVPSPGYRLERFEPAYPIYCS